MVRAIKKEDASSICTICKEVLGHDTTTEILEKRIEKLSLDSSYYIAIYTDSRNIAKGFIQAEKYSLLYGDDGWNIIALAVATEYQGQGIGTKLVSSLESHAKALGDSFIRLNSRIERLKAHEFYIQLGYKCDKTQKRFIKYL